MRLISIFLMTIRREASDEKVGDTKGYKCARTMTSALKLRQCDRSDEQDERNVEQVRIFLIYPYSYVFNPYRRMHPFARGQLEYIYR